MQINDKTLQSILTLYNTRRQEQVDLAKRYRYEKSGVPILTREYYIGNVKQENKINNKINNDFFGEIVNTKVGYFMGQPVSVSIPREKYSEADFKKFNDVLSRWNTINDIDNMNSDTSRHAATAGYGGRLLYIGDDGDVHALNVPSYQCIFIGDNPYRSDLAIRLYSTFSVGENGTPEFKYKAEVYDKKDVYVYTGPAQTSIGSIDTPLLDPVTVPFTWKLERNESHLFDGCPLIKFRNNDDERGDAENVLALIDTYDRVISDLDNELEQFRLAYMVFYGSRPDTETLEALLRTGALAFDSADSRAEFLTKAIDGATVFETLNRIQQNILHFSSTPNFRDESFSGNLSGVALDFKTRAFEAKCIVAEREFTSSLREQWRLILDIWKKKNIGVYDYADLQFTFTRNYPRNTFEEAQTTAILKGMVSEQTRLAQLSFVKDPYTEHEQMEQDNENSLDLNAIRTAMEADNGMRDEEKTETTEKIKLKRPVVRPE